ncbi:hypothetical protein MSNKSG1_01773 [Marinobacter santoriniensis NKSG1]|uniref:Peptidase C39-like domain-containing protein n=1 Tax=Marinobacter santoriniensis NKSG1 TaxID=1288826 RepID=M7CW04_9GAMM|nr:PA2778 family cysteine peptidase [Marinobacter santoriniensis]EMP57309.1 hypothetical protein MSNKSG1_01773 [Marinobacter santoriniensis NKSG1]
MHYLKLACRITALFTVVLLAGCATAPPWPDLQPSTGDQQSSELLGDVPFYPQEKYQCGPASLAMMLNAQGLDTTPEQLKDLVYIPERTGSLQVEMVATARAHDMVVYPIDNDLKAVFAEVTQGHPVLVMQNLLFDWWPQWHFAVVVGFNSHDKTVILNTDTRQHYAMAYETFSATWQRADGWAVVILPPDTLPATAKPLSYLRAAHDLEATGHIAAADKAYVLATDTWPDEFAAWMALGNLRFSEGDWTGAVSGFFQAVQHFPKRPEGWNNLAFALDKANCPSGAKDALDCAQALAPNTFDDTGLDGESSGTSDNCPTLPACPTPPR